MYSNIYSFDSVVVALGMESAAAANKTGKIPALMEFTC